MKSRSKNEGERIADAFSQAGPLLDRRCNDHSYRLRYRREAGAGKAPGPVVPKGKVEGKLTISQWPLYVDPGKRGTIAEFEGTSGVDVKYVEEINDNAEFFGKLRPLLERGDSGGRSLITVSDWLAARMYRLGYLQRFD